MPQSRHAKHLPLVVVGFGRIASVSCVIDVPTQVNLHLFLSDGDGDRVHFVSCETARLPVPPGQNMASVRRDDRRLGNPAHLHR